MTWIVDEAHSFGEHDLAGSAGWHMSVDQWLLDDWLVGSPNSNQRDDLSFVMRLYQWKSPTLSLGYFQSLAERESHHPSKDLDLVRRASGGGAIAHDHELTYSIAISNEHLRRLLPVLTNHPSPRRKSIEAASANQRLYGAVHHWIVETLAGLGISVSPYSDLPRTLVKRHSSIDVADTSRKDAHPFLCFQRRTSDDLIISGYKVVGSAQRRNRFGVLQHGSILWKSSNGAPELPGIADVSGTHWHIADLRKALLDHWADKTQTKIREFEFSRNQVSAIDKICTTRFANQRWSSKR
ncbi:MAG: hypothetical protein AAF664_08350 [Planctomycetota bacterium]